MTDSCDSIPLNPLDWKVHQTNEKVFFYHSNIAHVPRRYSEMRVLAVTLHNKHFKFTNKAEKKI